VQDLPLAASQIRKNLVLSFSRFTAFPLFELYDYGIPFAPRVLARHDAVQPFRGHGQLIFEDNPMVVKLAVIEKPCDGT
jgi:hypothetical protein